MSTVSENGAYECTDGSWSVDTVCNCLGVIISRSDSADCCCESTSLVLCDDD